MRADFSVREPALLFRARLPRNPWVWLLIAFLAIGIPVAVASVLLMALGSLLGARLALGITSSLLLTALAWFVYRMIMNKRNTWYELAPHQVTVHEMVTRFRTGTSLQHLILAWNQIGHIEAWDYESIQFSYGIGSPDEQKNFTICLPRRELNLRFEQILEMPRAAAPQHRYAIVAPPGFGQDAAVRYARPWRLEEVFPPLTEVKEEVQVRSNRPHRKWIASCVGPPLFAVTHFWSKGCSYTYLSRTEGAEPELHLRSAGKAFAQLDTRSAGGEVVLVFQPAEPLPLPLLMMASMAVIEFRRQRERVD